MWRDLIFINHGPGAEICFPSSWRSSGSTGSTHRRPLELIGNIPPAEVEEQYYAVADNIDMAAWLTNPTPPAKPARFTAPCPAIDQDARRNVRQPHEQTRGWLERISWCPV